MRNRTVRQPQAGISGAVVARNFGVACVTVHRLRGRFQQSGDVKDNHRCGRPTITIVTYSLLLLQNNFQQAPKFRGSYSMFMWFGMSLQTVENRLHVGGLKPGGQEKGFNDGCT